MGLGEGVGRLKGPQLVTLCLSSYMGSYSHRLGCMCVLGVGWGQTEMPPLSAWGGRGSDLGRGEGMRPDNGPSCPAQDRLGRFGEGALCKVLLG